MTKTAAEYRDSAAKHLADREESFQRCDTDGFLSQWASGLSASLDRAKAEIREHGDTAEFVGLYDGNRRVAARIIESQFGHTIRLSWLLSDAEAAKYGRQFVPTGSTSTIQKKLGLREAREMAPAWARIDGKGRGLSGKAWVAVYRTGDEFGLDATLTQPI